MYHTETLSFIIIIIIQLTKMYIISTCSHCTAFSSGNRSTLTNLTTRNTTLLVNITIMLKRNTLINSSHVQKNIDGFYKTRIKFYLNFLLY